MKNKIIVLLTVLMTMVYTTLSANEIVVTKDADGKIIITGWITGATECSIDVFVVDEYGNKIRVSSNEFSDVNYYVIKLKAGFNYQLVFDNGVHKQYVEIEDVDVESRFLVGRRVRLQKDVAFNLP